MKSGFLIVLFTGLAISVRAQELVDSVIILPPTKNLYFKRLDNNTELQILSGTVKLKQGNTFFYSDSCVLNAAGHLFEAFGNIHIQDDTTDIYSNYLRYHTDTKMAYLSGNVRMSDGHATLTTPDLEYDVANKIGTYKNGGRVVNKKSVLTSREGIYYSDLRDIYFKNNVELKDPAYTLKTDSLIYNTDTQIARFIAETFIRDSSGVTIQTREGYYDLANRKAEFFSRTTIRDKAMIASADKMASDEASGIMQLEGNAVIRDTAQGYILMGGRVFRNTKTDALLATKKPLMIIKQDEDSIYIAADTLFSAQLTDLYKNDSAKLKTFHFKEKDSTNRYFEGFRNVRMFSDSVQSVGDSLFYSFVDSTFELFYDPVVWNGKSQITGDTIYLYTKNKKASRIKTIENSFIVNEVDPGVYNQIRSSRMDGFFVNGQLDSVRAKGLAESVYFIQDDDSAYTSVNQTRSDAIDIYFDSGQLYKVVFRSDLKGTLYPVSQKKPDEMKLNKFRWLINRRPKTKYELFE